MSWLDGGSASSLASSARVNLRLWVITGRVRPKVVIAVTAFAMKGDEERIRQGGCEAYISKPISVVKFLETVRNYLGKV